MAAARLRQRRRQWWRQQGRWPKERGCVTLSTLRRISRSHRAGFASNVARDNGAV